MPKYIMFSWAADPSSYKNYYVYMLSSVVDLFDPPQDKKISSWSIWRPLTIQLSESNEDLNHFIGFFIFMAWRTTSTGRLADSFFKAWLW